MLSNARRGLRNIRKYAANTAHAWQLRDYAIDISIQMRQEGNLYRRSGIWYPQDIEPYAASVGDIGGAFAEIGVRYGDTFCRLIPLAQAQSKTVFAVDSFEGTKKTCEFDGRPDYDMSIGGVQVFFNRMDRSGFKRDLYQTLVGWIPDVFERFPQDSRFSFVIIDVDNYTPTRDAVNFIWPRINVGGVLLLDDFCTYHQIDAGRYIREFLRDQSDYWIERILPNYQIILRKS